MIVRYLETISGSVRTVTRMVLRPFLGLLSKVPVDTVHNQPSAVWGTITKHARHCPSNGFVFPDYSDKYIGSIDIAMCSTDFIVLPIVRSITPCFWEFVIYPSPQEGDLIMSQIALVDRNYPGRYPSDGSGKIQDTKVKPLMLMSRTQSCPKLRISMIINE